MKCPQCGHNFLPYEADGKAWWSWIQMQDIRAIVVFENATFTVGAGIQTSPTAITFRIDEIDLGRLIRFSVRVNKEDVMIHDVNPRGSDKYSIYNTNPKNIMCWIEIPAKYFFEACCDVGIYPLKEQS